MRSLNKSLILSITLTLFIHCSEGGRNEYNQAHLLQEQGKLEMSISEYEKLIEEEKRGRWVEMAREQIEICKALLIYQSSEEFLREGDVKKAEVLLLKANKKHRIEYKAMYIKGRIYLLEGKLERAELIFLDLIKKYPVLPEGHLGLALIEEEQGKMGSAILNYGKVMRYTKDLMMREEAEIGLERIAESEISGEVMGLIEEQITYSQGTPKLLKRIGRYYLYEAEEPDYNKAISFFNRVLSFDEIDDEFKLSVYIDIARAYELGGGTSTALNYIDMGLDIDPENVELLEIKRRIQSSG